MFYAKKMQDQEGNEKNSVEIINKNREFASN